MEDDGIIYGHLVRFTVFFIFCGHLVYFVVCNLVYFFLFWYFVPRKIWQPCLATLAAKCNGAIKERSSAISDEATHVAEVDSVSPPFM
jgi:hypothetical protein